MNDLTFNIASTAVFCPGKEATYVAEMLPAQANECSILPYKEASKLLGRKGLRYKDQATLLALVAAKKVLTCADALMLSEADKIRTAVIVSSNLSNVDTVVENAQIIAQNHVNETSAMALPNASSNAVSASIAIVNGLKGPNLMLCNGKNSGLDALKLAIDLMSANRADRVLVIGVEVTNNIIAAIFPTQKVRFNGAAGYLIEANRSTSQSGIKALAQLRTSLSKDSAVSAAEVFEHCGDASGATGVLQLILAAEYAKRGESRTVAIGAKHWQVDSV